MARVTAAKVKQVINVSTAATDSIITVHIEVANRMVTDILGGDLGDDRLADIELYLSAHFTAIFDKDNAMATEKAIGSARDSYYFQNALGPNLASTLWGQTATLLDTTDKLSGVGGTSGKKAKFGSHGHVP